MSSEVMEVVRFRSLAPLGEQSASVHAWLRARPGFVARVLLGPDAQGGWVDVVRWRSMADAEAAAAAMGSEPSLASFLLSIDPESVVMEHWPVAAELRPPM